MSAITEAHMVLDLFKIIWYNLWVIKMLMIVVYIVKAYFRSPSDLNM